MENGDDGKSDSERKCSTESFRFDMEPVVKRLQKGFKNGFTYPAKRKACQSDTQLAGAQKRIEIIDDMFAPARW